MQNKDRDQDIVSSEDQKEDKNSESQNPSEQEQEGSKEINLEETSSEDLEQKLITLQQNYAKLQESYEQLMSNHNAVNTKFLSFAQAYNSLNKRYDEQKAEMDEYKQTQRDGAKVEAATMLFALHNNLKMMLNADSESVILKMIMSEVENIFAQWSVEIICPKEGDIFDAKEFRVISSKPTEDEEQKNRICKVVYVGYKIGSRLIRAADVEIFV